MALFSREAQTTSPQWPEQGQWTYATWAQLPDDEYRYEVIDGVLYRGICVG